MKHLEVRHLWVQGYVQAGDVTIKWIPRHQNPTDGLTHATTSGDFWRRMRGLNLEFTSHKTSWSYEE